MKGEADAKHFFGIYVSAASNMDNSTVWNEIDISYANGPGFQGMTFGTATFTPKEHVERFDSTTEPSYTRTQALK